MDRSQKQLVNEMKNTLFGWYDFEKDKSVLVISHDKDESLEIVKYLISNGINASWDNTNLSMSDSNDKYDYFIIYGVLEWCDKPEDFLRDLYIYATDNSKLLIATDNRISIKYFCGDRDPFTGHIFDGVDGYVRVSNKRKSELAGRCYSYSELIEILKISGLTNNVFYSVLPDIKCPQILLSQEYKPNETLEARIFPHYNSPKTVFMEEEKLYDTLSKNGLLTKMAGGFLIECSFNEDVILTNMKQITLQPDRGHEQSLATLINSDNTVVKKALYQEGIDKISLLTESARYLIEHGVDVVYSKTDGKEYRMPFVDGKLATLYFREQAIKGKDEFVNAIILWKNIIENSSEHVNYNQVNWKHFDPYWRMRKTDDPNIEKWEKISKGTEDERREIGVILKRGYIDLVSLNCFYKDGKFLFFDQEFYVEDFPANSIMIRTIDFIYRDCPDLEDIYPRDELLKGLHLYEHKDMWRKKASAFLEELRNEIPLKEYHQKTRRNQQVTEANRFRMDYTQDEYDQLFKSVFKNIDSKKIYIFGSGIYAQKFIDIYGMYLNVAGILDNNAKRWGEEFGGVRIVSPKVLLNEKESYKVIICIKFYDDVFKQLKNMGVKDISIYETRIAYERPVKPVIVKKENEDKKKYHIGYIAGVFDLFHLGHVNLLRRAKEQCDYLIVGVVSDEQIINGKGTKPYMSFEERREIVESCKYVDEAVAIPLDRPDTEDAWRLYRFDVQFSGSDYENDPKWLAKREFLRERGSDLVFFPYTQSVSSTKLKEKIREK